MGIVLDQYPMATTFILGLARTVDDASVLSTKVAHSKQTGLSLFTPG